MRRASWWSWSEDGALGIAYRAPERILMTAGASDRGDRHDLDDAWLVARHHDAVLCAVCDGMGAMTSGRPAADLAVTMLGARFDVAVASLALPEVIREVHATLAARSAAAARGEAGADPRWLGMRTTVEAALFVAGRVRIAHVGDGRVYRSRDGRLEALTTDHTLREAHRAAHPDATEAELDRLPRFVVTRVLGSDVPPTIDELEQKTEPGDVFLLCSDGLVCGLDDAVIASHLATCVDPAETVRALVAAALASPRRGAAGTRDNVTAIVHVVGEDPRLL